ncbi:MFS transporter [Dactylosporangium sp. NPDC051541]|uniref:MFS transporter n=1 Tax=Dactylosporangium sp. NPDC051541 TaxID=3363977 RepID=UPI0037AAB91D
MYRLLLRRDFGLMWSGHLLSNLGNWLLILAIPVYVFELTGSVASTSAAVVAQTVPALLVGPIAGVAADQWNRRTIMLLSDLLRALVVVGFLFVHSAGDLWLLYATVFMESCVAQLFLPAHRALLPGLVGRGADLSAANALYTLAGGIVRLAGGPLGGALYLLLGFDALVLIDMATYVVSAVALLAVRYSPSTLRAGTAGGPGHGRPVRRLRAVRRDLAEGAQVLWRSVLLIRLLASSAVFLLGNSTLTVLLVPYVYQRLHGDAALVGLLFSALGAGFLIGAPPARRMADAARPHRALAAALAAANLSFIGLFHSQQRPIALLSICAVGVTGGAVLVVVQTLIQRYTPDQVLGRVSSAYASVEMLATVIGAVAGGAVAAGLGLTVAADTAIAIVAVSILLALTLPAPAAERAPESSETPPGPNWPAAQPPAEADPDSALRQRPTPS